MNAWGITPSTWRTPSASFTMSCPPMRAVPEVGGVSVVIMRISVVFPAPFGPSSPKISPSRDVEADVVHRHQIAELFHQMVDFNRIHAGVPERCV